MDLQISARSKAPWWELSEEPPHFDTEPPKDKDTGHGRFSRRHRPCQRSAREPFQVFWLGRLLLLQALFFGFALLLHLALTFCKGVLVLSQIMSSRFDRKLRAGRKARRLRVRFGKVN